MSSFSVRSVKFWLTFDAVVDDGFATVFTFFSGATEVGLVVSFTGGVTIVHGTSLYLNKSWSRQKDFDLLNIH